MQKCFCQQNYLKMLENRRNDKDTTCPNCGADLLEKILPEVATMKEIDRYLAEELKNCGK